MKDLTASKVNLWTSDFIFAFIANFLMGFSFYLLMPTLPFYLIEVFHVSKSLIGIIVSCFVIAALLMRPFSGYIVDSFPRKLVYIFSFIPFVVLYFGYIIAGSIAFLIVLRLLHGLTWGIITTAGNTLAIDIMPSEKRGQGIGFYGLALNISMAIGPLAGIFLYQHYNFNALFYTAIISGAIAMILVVFIKAPKRQTKIVTPLSFDRFFMVKGIPVGINLFMITISYGMIISFAALYCKETQATNPGLFFTLLAIGIAISRIFSGKLIDKGKLYIVTMIGIVILAIGFIAFSAITIPSVYYMAALIIGLGYGIALPAFQTIFVNMAPHHQRGTANSTYYSAFDLGVGAGMLIAGQIANMFSLSMAFGFSALMCTLSILYFWKISSISYAKHKITNK